MSDDTDLVTLVARAICVADGVNPDQIGYGMGYSVPRGINNYRMWEARRKQAEAAIACIYAHQHKAPEDGR